MCEVCIGERVRRDGGRSRERHEVADKRCVAACTVSLDLSRRVKRQIP